MAATVFPWAKPGAWALDSEEHEPELLQQHQQQQAKEKDSFDFPSLSAAAAIKQPKKKKGQTISLAEFTTYGAPKPPSRTSEPVGLIHEDRLKLLTGPRERTVEELDRKRLGGSFRSFDRISNGSGADSYFWGKKREDNNGGTGNESESGSGRRNLQPRTLPINNSDRGVVF